MMDAKVLMAGEGQELLQTTRRKLEDLGYQVLAVASTAEEALRTAEDNPPDLLLVDSGWVAAFGGAQSAGPPDAVIDAPVLYLASQADDGHLSAAGIDEPWRYVLASCTERELLLTVEAAIRHHRLERTLWESEETHRNLAELSDEGIVIVQDHRFCYVNPRIAEILGCSGEELVGQSVLDYVHPDDRRWFGSGMHSGSREKRLLRTTRCV